MTKKQTRREKLLAEIRRVVPWTRLIAVIESLYPTSGGVRRQPIVNFRKPGCFSASDGSLAHASLHELGASWRRRQRSPPTVALHFASSSGITVQERLHLLARFSYDIQAFTETLMSAGTSNSALDRQLVSLKEGCETRHWHRTPACTHEQASFAAEAVGNSAEAVRDHLAIASKARLQPSVAE